MISRGESLRVRERRQPDGDELCLGDNRLPVRPSRCANPKTLDIYSTQGRPIVMSRRGDRRKQPLPEPDRAAKSANFESTSLTRAVGTLIGNYPNTGVREEIWRHSLGQRPSTLLSPGRGKVSFANVGAGLGQRPFPISPLPASMAAKPPCSLAAGPSCVGYAFPGQRYCS